MTPRLSPWLIAVLVVELLIALLFFAFGWSLTSSLAQGRSPSMEDTLFLASPVLVVIVCGALSVLAWRAQKQSIAWVLALLPLPLAFVLFGLLGAI